MTLRIQVEQLPKTHGQGAFRFRDRIFSFPGAIMAILLGKTFWTCRERIADTDLGWHLRNGQYLTGRWSFPTHDTYSFTAAGSRWLDHSWLPEVVYFSAYRILGVRGIFVVFLLTVSALVLTIFLLSLKRAEDPLAAAVVTIFGGLLAMVGFTPRAQNFGWLCFAAVFAILLRFRETRRAPLWLVPPLFCLWINCHAGWPFGLTLLLIILAAGLIRQDLGQVVASPWTKQEIKILTLTLAASVAALFINPFGYRLVLYPFDLAFRQGLNVSLGGEWVSVDFNDSRGLFVMVTLAAVLITALLPRKPWRVQGVLLAGFAIFCGLKHIRFLMITGIVLPPILAPQLGRLSSHDPARERRWLNAIIIAAVAGMMLLSFPTNQHLEAELNEIFPVGAVTYLEAHPQEGNIFNQYEWGGYLEWRLPQVKTFVDSRTDIFEYKGVLRDYVRISSLSESQALLDAYKVEYILYPTGAPLSYFLSKSPQWKCIFRDGQAVIYRRVKV